MKLQRLSRHHRYHSKSRLQPAQLGDDFFNITPDLYILLDLAGRVLEFNGSFENLFNSQKTLINCLLRDIFPLPTARKILRIIRLVDHRRISSQFECIIPTSHGPCQVEIRLHPTPNHRVLAVVRNITERTDSYRQLIELAPDGIIIANEYYRIIEANTAACSLLGYEKEELLNLPLLRIIHSKSRSKLHPLLSAIQSGQTCLDELALRHCQGHPLAAEISAKRLPNGRLQAFVRNIEERKSLEKEMLRLDRLNTVGEMAASLGHEIRNPMTSVRGFLQLLQRKPHCQPFQDYFGIMIEELDRVNKIITEFLSLAKNKVVDLNYFDLNEIIRAIYPLLEADALANNHIITLDLKPLQTIKMDDKEIRQLLLNLCRNGLEAMHPGGHLWIRTYCKEHRNYLEIEDEGCGIPPAILEKMGTPFLTTKENGIGIGLAVCYRIATRHQAQIEVSSSSKGTIFTISFPGQPHQSKAK